MFRAYFPRCTQVTQDTDICTVHQFFLSPKTGGFDEC